MQRSVSRYILTGYRHVALRQSLYTLRLPSCSAPSVVIYSEDAVMQSFNWAAITAV